MSKCCLRVVSKVAPIVVNCEVSNFTPSLKEQKVKVIIPFDGQYLVSVDGFELWIDQLETNEVMAEGDCSEWADISYEITLYTATGQGGLREIDISSEPFLV